MTECDICKDGKDYKNLPVHKRFKHKLKSSDPAGDLFLKPLVPLESPSTPSKTPAVDNHNLKSESDPADIEENMRCNTQSTNSSTGDNYKKHFWQFWKKKAPKTQKEHLDKTFPSRLLSTQEIKDIKFNNPIVLTDEQKFLRFFGNLPKWTEYKPGWFATKMAKLKTKADFTIKSCVFVDDEGENKKCWLPYNPQLGLLFTENGFYDMPIKDTEPIFLDKTKFSPLVNRKNYKDDFDIPEDLAASLVNTGVGYGQLDKFKELIAKIDRLQIISIASIIMVVVVVIAVAYINYAQGEHYKALANAVMNTTRGN